ncbi:hypothetical protein H0X48_04885 [Candidatus Dependentiae bacterium]|nr:hypothetical protein [Candidatus Dependentiae bacterium]
MNTVYYTRFLYFCMAVLLISPLKIHTFFDNLDGDDLSLFEPSIDGNSQDVSGGISGDLSDDNSGDNSGDPFAGSNDNEITPTQSLVAECISDIAILSLIAPRNDPTILPIINVPALLKEDIYLRTNPFVTRSLLDLPSLQPLLFESCDWSFSAQAFYNQTSRAYFSCCSPFIQSYIDLTNQNIINEIETALSNELVQEQVPSQLQGNIPLVLGLFSTVKLQQRRAGLMLGLRKEFGKFNLSASVPFYYLENNFFLTDEEQERIGNNPFFRNEQSAPVNSDEDRVEQYFMQHLLADRVGFGDTRVRALANIYEKPNTAVWLGLELTLPTATHFNRGVIGGTFNSTPEQPKFNIKRLFSLTPLCPRESAAQERASAVLSSTVQEFFIQALDRLSTILLNTPLGNSHHRGFGPRLDVKHYFNNYVSAHTMLAFEYFNKRREARFYKVRKDAADFNRDYEDEALASSNIEFLNAQIINTFFPRSYVTTIRPGSLTKFRQNIRYDSKHWQGTLGFDYWRLGKEKRGHIASTLVKPKSARPAASQGKVFGSFGYFGSAFCQRIAWNFLLTGEVTAFNKKGIGTDFTVGASIGVDF